MTSNAIFSSLTNKVSRSIKEKGLIKTLRRILYYFEGYLFDMRYNTDTFLPVVWDAQGVEDTKKVHFSNYDSIHIVSLRNMFRSLGIEPGKVMVDLGCGKGRVLLIASEFGFKEARGVEFFPVLCAIARNNCSLYKTQTKTNTDFAVIESDVRDYRIRDDEDVFYIYNTFNGDVLTQVLQDICESFQRRKRKIWIIYCIPSYGRREIVIETGSPVKVLNFTFMKHNFLVYEVEEGPSSDCTDETDGKLG